MKEKFLKHIGYYAAFTLVQLLGMVMIVTTAGNRQLQLAAILGTTIFYFLFAIAHHLLDHHRSERGAESTRDHEQEPH